MSKFLTLLLVLTPFLLFSQSTKELKWIHSYPLQLSKSRTIYMCQMPRQPFSYKFFKNHTFEYIKSNDIYGCGTYEIVDSTIICQYSGKATLEDQYKKSWVEVQNNPSHENHLKIRVLEAETLETQIGARIDLFDAKNQLIGGTSSNFDGEAIIERQDFQKIKVSYLGYKSLTTEVSNLKKGGIIVFHLEEGKRIVAKGITTKHQIMSIEGKRINMRQVDYTPMIYIEESN